MVRGIDCKSLDSGSNLGDFKGTRFVILSLNCRETVLLGYICLRLVSSERQQPKVELIWMNWKLHRSEWCEGGYWTPAFER